MSESIVAQKFTKIHMVKMIKCITGLDLKESIQIFDEHMKLEDLDYAYNTPKVVQGREKMQADLLSKMLNNNIKKELKKEVDRMDDEIHNLIEKRNMIMDNLMAKS